MKITILSENLQKKLSLINKAVSSRNPLPILSNILIETKDKSLVLSSTDLEIGVQVTIPVEIEEEGSTTVPSRLFSELISSLPNEKLILVASDSAFEVKSRKTKSTFQTIPSNEFPKLYEDLGKEIARVKVEDLQEDLRLVVLSASPDSTRPALSGILVKEEDEKLVFVATDGYRLSLKQHRVKSKEDKSFIELEKPLLIPARLIREVLSLKERGEMVLYVSDSSNQIIFKLKDTLIVGRLIEADFPNYQKIIPSEETTKVSFDREELLKAIKICSIFARETANIIKLSIKKDMIMVSANTPSVGENTVEIEAKLVGEENEIAFNAKYVLDILSAVPDDDMIFEMTGPLNPGVFKIEKDPSFLHIIMPIRVQG